MFTLFRAITRMQFSGADFMVGAGGAQTFTSTSLPQKNSSPKLA